jgi:hypothetical protein
VEFAFTESSTSTSLAPGARVLIVRNLAAFTAAHGAGHPVAGVFANDTALNNAGEPIKLDDPLNNSVKELMYDNDVPWPAADGTGASLVLIHPETNPDPADPANWRSSTTAGGNPGGEDSLPFTGNPDDDLDQDGLSRLMEYSLGTSDTTPSQVDFQSQYGSDGGKPFLELTTTRQLNADDAIFAVVSSSNLISWSDGNVVLRSTSPGPAGLVTEVWRISDPTAGNVLFVR